MVNETTEKIDFPKFEFEHSVICIESLVEFSEGVVVACG